MSRATIQDVARAAGVSTPVVSMVLNRRRNTVRASEATRLKVIEAARTLNYRPSVLARGFRSDRSFLIGLAGVEVNAPWLGMLVSTMQEKLETDDYSLVVDTARDFATQQQAINRLLNRHVEGLIATAVIDGRGRTDAALFQRINSARVPVVEIFSQNIPGAPKINVDMRGIGREQTRHLLALGHRRIALLTHDHYQDARTRPGLHFDAWEQYEGYEAAMRAAGLEPIVVTQPVPPEPNADEIIYHFVRDGWRAVPLILNHPQRPTAVVCYNGRQAVGLMQACASRGVRVPDQLSVIAGASSRTEVPVLPELTLMLFPVRQIGERATALLCDLIAGRTVKSEVVPGRLFAGESTGPPAESNVT